MDLKKITAIADGKHAHAKSCNRPLGECRVCNVNIAWFAALPAHILSYVLREPAQR